MDLVERSKICGLRALAETVLENSIFFFGEALSSTVMGTLSCVPVLDEAETMCDRGIEPVRYRNYFFYSAICVRCASSTPDGSS